MFDRLKNLYKIYIKGENENDEVVAYRSKIKENIDKLQKAYEYKEQANQDYFDHVDRYNENLLPLAKAETSDFSNEEKVYAAVMLLNHNNEMLLLRRSSNDDFKPNVWCFPSGGMDEEDSNPYDAAIRELKEETNIDIENLYPVYEVKEDNGTHIYYYIGYLGSRDEDYQAIVLDKEHENFDWVYESEIYDKGYELILNLGEHIQQIQSKVSIAYNSDSSFAKAMRNKWDKYFDTYLETLRDCNKTIDDLYKSYIKSVEEYKENVVLKGLNNWRFKYYLENSLGIPRKSMPQIDKDNLDDFILHFQGNSGQGDTKVKKERMKLKDIRMTQGEIDEDKVLNILLSGNFNSRYIVASDKYLLDGHHNFAGEIEFDPEKEVDVYRVNLPIKELLRRSKLMKIARKEDISSDVVKKDFDKAINQSKFDKGKKANIGEVRQFKDGLYKKYAENDWRPYSESDSKSKDNTNKEKKSDKVDPHYDKKPIEVGWMKNKYNESWGVKFGSGIIHFASNEKIANKKYKEAMDNYNNLSKKSPEKRKHEVIKNEKENRKEKDNYKFDNEKFEYHVRFSDHINEDLKRNWSSWNFGQDGLEGNEEEIEQMKKEAIENNKPLFISGMELWEDDIKNADIRELYNNYWVLVDNVNAKGGLSSHELPNSIEDLKQAKNEIEDRSATYDGAGDGNVFDGNKARVIYSEGNMHILEVGDKISKAINQSKSDIPNYRKAEGEKNCGNCGAYSDGYCKMFDANVYKNYICDDWVEEYTEKGRKANIGEKRNWNGKWYQKQASGDWKYIGDDQQSGKKKEISNSEAIKNFNDWFGDSKVVDENGNPKVVYHGVGKGGKFDEFKEEMIGKTSGNVGHFGKGFYFTNDKGSAQTFSEMYGGTGEVMPVYLKMENPFYPTQDNLIALGEKYDLELPDKQMVGFDTDNLYNQIKQKDEVAAELYKLINEKGYEEAWEEIANKYSNDKLMNTNIDLNDVSDWAEANQIMDIESYVENMKQEYGIEPEIKYEYREMGMDRLTNLGEKGNEWGEAIKKEGYDGVDAGDELVVFESTQIKSAEKNTGKYDESDPNIHKATKDELESMIKEHERLVSLLEKYKDEGEDIKKEYETQKKELKEYKEKLEKESK